jgi:CRP/FNR family transcriptional regulator
MIIHPQKKETDFFKEIERVLAPYFVRAHFRSGHILWNEGETAGKMVTIIQGKVKIFRPLADGKQAPIYIFGPGDTFGFLPFIDGSPYPASAEILEDTQALVMTREKFHAAMRQNPDVAIFLLGHLGKRLRNAFDQIERLSTRGVLPRTAAALVSLSVRPGKNENSEIVSLPVSSREYAAFIGLTPESFSRGITRLVDAGILHRLGGNSFQILDPERLNRESQKES